jgi:predicted dehydrogenase
MTRIGIIGLGFMGRMHYDTYAKIPEAQVVAVCDADPRRAAGDLSGGWGNVAGATTEHLPMDRIRGTTDPAALLAMPDVDIVDVCLPTPAHVQIVTAALAAGKHVLCEKPMARTAAEARQIASAAAAARGMFMPAMCLRFWSEWEWLKQAVVDNRYGKLRSLAIRRLGSMPAGWFSNGKLSGGAILDLHVHDTDFIYYLLGKPAAVFSRGYRAGSGEIDHVHTQYLYGDSAGDAPAISAEGSWAMDAGWPFSMRYTANFERASADYDSSRTPTLLLYAGGTKEEIAVSTQDGYFGELRYFIDCVSSGRKPDRVTAADAVAALEIVEAEKTSVESGEIVKISR